MPAQAASAQAVSTQHAAPPRLKDEARLTLPCAQGEAAVSDRDHHADADDAAEVVALAVVQSVDGDESVSLRSRWGAARAETRAYPSSVWR
jgi:hypothetical protein